MKYSKLIYATGACVVIVSSLMKIFHMPNANTVFVLTLIAMIIFQSYHVRILERKIKALESSSHLRY